MTNPIPVAPEVALQEQRALEAYLRQRGLIQAQAIADLQAHAAELQATVKERAEAEIARQEEIDRLRVLLARNGIDPDPPADDDEGDQP